MSSLLTLGGASTGSSPDPRIDVFAGDTPALAAAFILRFLLELALLAAAGTIAWRLAPQGWRAAAAITAVVAVAAVWGLFLSPAPVFVIPAIAGLALETALFVGMGAGLVAMGLALPGIALAAMWALDRVAIALLIANLPG